MSSTEDIDKSISRFKSHQTTNSTVHTGVRPSEPLGNGLIGSLKLLEEKSANLRADDGMKGIRYALVIKTVPLEGIHQISDPGVVDVLSSAGADHDLVGVNLHYGIAAGTTGAVITDPKDLTQLSRFYEFFSDSSTSLSTIRDGDVVRIRMMGPNHGMFDSDTASNAQGSSATTPTETGEATTGSTSKSMAKGAVEGRTDIGPQNKNNPGVGSEKNTTGVDDPNSFKTPPGVPPIDKKYIPGLKCLRKLDRSGTYKVINNAFGLILSPPPSHHYRRTYGSAERSTALSELERRQKLLDDKQIPLLTAKIINLKSPYKNQQIYGMYQNGMGYVGWVTEDRVTANPNISKQGGQPQIVAGTKETIDGLIKMEKVWTKLRYSCVLNKKPDPGSIVENIYNGYRSLQCSFFRVWNKTNRDGWSRGKKCSQRKTGKNGKYTMRTFMAYDSAHVYGVAVDIKMDPIYPNDAISKHNWKRMIAILSRMLWGKTPGDKTNGARMRFGFAARAMHCSPKTPGKMGGKFWYYNGTPAASGMPLEQRRSPRGDYPSFSVMASAKYKKTVFGELEEGFPGWQEILYNNNAWPSEFGKPVIKGKQVEEETTTTSGEALSSDTPPPPVSSSEPPASSSEPPASSSETPASSSEETVSTPVTAQGAGAYGV